MKNDNFPVNSYQYAEQMRKSFDPDRCEGNFQRDIHLDYHHPLVDYLKKKWVLETLDWLVKPRREKKKTRLEEIFFFTAIESDRPPAVGEFNMRSFIFSSIK